MADWSRFFHDCDDASGWSSYYGSSVPTVNSIDFQQGIGCVELIETELGGVVGLNSAINLNKDYSTADSIHAWVKIIYPEVAFLSHLELALFDTSWKRIAYTLDKINNQWVELKKAKSDYFLLSGGFNYKNIHYFHVYGDFASIYGLQATIRVDDVYFSGDYISKDISLTYDLCDIAYRCSISIKQRSNKLTLCLQ